MPGFYLPTDEEFDPKTDDFIEPCLTKERRYRHFDLPLSDDEREQTRDFAVEVAPHRFLPLLGYTDEVRKYLRRADGSRYEKVKKRPIRFASHADAAYLQAYAEHLNRLYEQALSAEQFGQSVLAYRKGGATNIHHAKGLFDEIRERGDCQVFALDISGFFDTLDHGHLKSELLALLNVQSLEGHHWTVFKNMTRYSWVETEDIDFALGKKRNRHGRVCSPEDFKNHIRGRSSGLVRSHDLPYGIPQGTPISGLYANIYMMTFDRVMTEATADMGGSYRRYSDDIAIVLPVGIRVHHLVALIEKHLGDFHLELSSDKTETATYRGGRLTTEQPIQYLGFTFDGASTLIRASSLDAYRSKMRRGIHAKLVAAKQKNVPSAEVYKREPLSRYTHMGKRRNFIKYAYMAAEIMKAPEIREQVKDHVKWFNRAWDREVTAVYGGLVKVT